MNKAVVLLDAIENRKDQVIKDLQKDLKDRINEAVKQLSKYLSSDDTKSRFISWNPEELPPAEKSSWKETEDKIESLLSNRLQEIIQKWEEDKMVFQNACESFLQHIQQRFTSVVDELVELQRSVTRKDPTGSNQDSSWRILPTSIAAISGIVLARCSGPGIAAVATVAGATGAPSAAVVAAVPVAVAAVALIIKKVGTAVSDGHNLTKYKEDRKAFMAEKSASFLADAAQTNNVKKLVEEMLRGLKDNLAKIEAHLPQLIKADKNLYQHLQAEERSQDALCRVYQPIKDEASKLIGQLVVFGIKNVFDDQIKSEELIWKEEKSSRLGSDAFGAVYEGQMESHEKVKVAVTLKVYKDEFFASNSIEVMNEVEYLR